MAGNKIIIWTSPVENFQKIYVFKDGVIVDQFGIQVTELNEILPALIEKYSINRLDFSGSHIYAEGLVKSFQESAPHLKFGLNDIRINYV